MAVSELKATKPPTLSVPCMTWFAPTQRKSAVESRPIVLQDAVVGHDDETAAESLLRDGEELVQHRVAESDFCRRGFDRFDAFDGVDLVRAVFALAFFDSGEKRPQDFDREIHQPDVERRRGEKRERQQRAVDDHQRERADQLNRAARSAPIPCCTANCAHLPRAVEAALNVAGAPAGEVGHRQRQHLPAQKIEDRGVESDRGEREQIFLRQERQLHEDDGDAHPEQDGLQQTDDLSRTITVSTTICGENGEEQLQDA